MPSHPVLRQAVTLTPMERAVPSTILATASRSPEFTSGSLVLAISRACSWLSSPACSRGGLEEPFGIPADLIKKAAGIPKGSAKPPREQAGELSHEQALEIAKTKLPDVNSGDLEAVAKMVEGTARSMGVKVTV